MGIMDLDQQRTKSNEGLVKIFFEFVDKNSPIASESLWAEPAGTDLYRLRNIPFYVYGFSENDIVNVQEKEGRLVVKRVVERGGHSTYRIFLAEGTTEEKFSIDWIPLKRLGCFYERATRRLVAVDVPPGVDVYAVYAALEKGEKDKLWEFEEAHYARPLRDSRIQ